MFIDRQRELAFLDGLLSRAKTGSAQLCMVTGRRRTGKTELLLHWANRSAVPYLYWAAVKETPWQQRIRLSARLFDEPLAAAPVYKSWAELWEAAVRGLSRNQHILILDNFPYAADADPQMASSLRDAWERWFRPADVTVILCGAQQRSMQDLLTDKSPLHGQVTAQLQVDPLPYAAIQPFFPGWDAETRVAAYAISGGVPAYLAWLNPGLDLAGNVEHTLLQPGSMFLAEPAYLLYDELREHNNYLGIL
ncbi:MAG: ATP-binding protein, partial [Anaerolineaceae bacterium]